MVVHRETRTESKALAVNLDPKRYGAFAEIGAGQEVVRWFFKVGGAAGTISKSISAYDMQVSDAIYGRAERYVSHSPDGLLQTVASLQVAGHLVKLYGYLVDRGCITQLDNFREKYLPILSRDVLARIKSGDSTWETMVPDGVARTIKENHFFGHPRQTL